MAGCILLAGMMFGLPAHSQESRQALPNAAPAEFAQFLHDHQAELGATVAGAGEISVAYPAEESLFPADLAPPLFQWRDANREATVWRIEVTFAERGPKVRLWSPGEKMQVGPVDDSLVGYVPPALTAEQADSHTWRPDAKTWEAIKRHSQRAPAVVRFSGFRSQDERNPVSTGAVKIRTSPDPVGAPIMYRDVPLIPPPPESEERGIIKPLPDSVLPKIKWQLRYVADAESRTVMTGLATCAKCHSASLDGKALGIDVDGPQNDKGLYALIRVKKVSSISNDYVVHWSAFSERRWRSILTTPRRG